MGKTEVLIALFASVFNVTFPQVPQVTTPEHCVPRVKKKVEQAGWHFEVPSNIDYSVIGNFCHYNTQGFKVYTCTVK